MMLRVLVSWLLAFAAVSSAQEAPAAAPPAAAPPAAAPPAAAPAAPPPPPPPPVDQAAVDAETAKADALRNLRGDDSSFVRACHYGDLEAFQKLLPTANKDAIYHEVNFESATCAHMAIRDRRGSYLQILQALITAGHPVDVAECASGSGWCRVPIWYAVEQGDHTAFDLLLPHTKSFRGEDERGFGMNSRACMNGHEKMCQALMGKTVTNDEAHVQESLRANKEHHLNPIRRLYGIEEVAEKKQEL